MMKFVNNTKLKEVKVDGDLVQKICKFQNLYAYANQIYTKNLENYITNIIWVILTIHYFIQMRDKNSSNLKLVHANSVIQTILVIQILY